MSKNSTVDKQIGAAWGQLREGNHNEAINQFEKVLESVPNNVDAHYGLGLSLRTAGREADAIDIFQKALEVSTEMLQAIRSQSGGDETSNNLQISEDDRYMMLTRMIKQRLEELGSSV